MLLLADSPTRPPSSTAGWVAEKSQLRHWLSGHAARKRVTSIR
jgi:hypothetical protein